MKKNVQILAVCAVAALVILALVFLIRAPIVVVSDEAFAALYGKKRMRAGQLHASLVSLRRVKQVIIADSAGADVLVLAVEEAATRPYCVFFPYRYEESARRYNDEFPDIPVALFLGRVDSGADETGQRESFFQFSSDTELDLYRAGLCAGILAGADERPIAILPGRNMRLPQRESFTRGVQETREGEPVFAASAAQLNAAEGYAVTVLAGSGADYLGKNPQSILVLFTWLDPAMTSVKAALIFDDSPWAQAAAALRMIRNGEKNGKIPAKPLIFPERLADNGVVDSLKKAARAVPEKNAVPGGNDLTKN